MGSGEGTSVLSSSKRTGDRGDPYHMLHGVWEATEGGMRGGTWVDIRRPEQKNGGATMF
jgi:hypothetical protein